MPDSKKCKRHKHLFYYIFLVIAIASVIFLCLAINSLKMTDAKIQKLANNYLNMWTSTNLREKCIQELHNQNPEWDFMFRTYSVLAFSNLALKDETKSEDYINAIDIIINDTLTLEKQSGFKYFLLQYGHNNNWEINPSRSLFVDGEIAIMLGCRCLVECNNQYQNELKERIEIITSRMKNSSVLCSESYPDECWVFCSTIALAAAKISDKLNGTDHSEFLSQWVTTAKEKLIEKKTGLLRSAFRLDGSPVDSAKGPEGSSIWMACHMMQLIDNNFALDQYQKAKKELLDNIFGFAYSREWPVSSGVQPDIDSGEIVPYINASPSASGLAIISTSAFNDIEYFKKILMSLNLFGKPVETEKTLYYQRSNALGDAVILYGLTNGPLWKKVKTP